MLVALYLRASRHVVQARPVITVYLVAEGLAAPLWLAGAVAPAPLRYLCWALAVAGEAAAPILATVRSAGLPLHLEHLPERFGLLIILVLGESVAAVAVGVHDTHWDPTTVTVAILAFVVAASLWWTYFDLTGAATTDTLTQRAGHRSTPLHDIYAYGHWPIALGLTAAGVGLEDAILHGNQPSLSTGARWILCGGIALYLLSLTAIQGGIAGSLRNDPALARHRGPAHPRHRPRQPLPPSRCPHRRGPHPGRRGCRRPRQPAPRHVDQDSPRGSRLRRHSRSSRGACSHSRQEPRVGIQHDPVEWASEASSASSSRSGRAYQLADQCRQAHRQASSYGHPQRRPPGPKQPGGLAELAGDTANPCADRPQQR